MQPVFQNVSQKYRAGSVSRETPLGLALKCKLINMHELIKKSLNNYVTLSKMLQI